VIKLNTDSAVLVDDGRAAARVVVRNNGGFIMATAKVYEGIVDPLIIEALALRDACTLAAEKGYERVIFESDCEVLIKLLKNQGEDLSVIKAILEEIRVLQSVFSSFSSVFACREANQAAHYCAKYAVIQNGSFIWEAEPPAFLFHILAADCNSMVDD
jgi:hypothetical protein